MSRPKPTPVITSNQGDLFQRLETPALDGNPHDLDIGLELLGAICNAIREGRPQGLSRERIVDRMNLALPDLERPITLRQLNSWTASSKEFHEFPLRYVAAFCWATGSDAPLRVLSQTLGYSLVDHRELHVKRLGETDMEIARLKREQHLLKRRLGA